MTDASVEMIEIDDLPSSQGNSVIVVDETQNISSTDEDPEYIEECQKIDEDIYHENKLISKIIKVCLKLEYSEGMSRVINKYMLSLYDQTDLNYKNSEELKKILNNTIHRLKTDPDHKFSHMKNLCDNLKLHKHKKRVNLITLSTCLSKSNGDSSGNSKNQCNSVYGVRKRPELDVIDLDDQEDAIIDLDSDIEMNLLHQNDKENNLPIINNNEKFEINTEHISNREFNNNVNLATGETTSAVSHMLEDHFNEVDNAFLVPVGNINVESQVIVEAKIKQIEEEIAFCKHQIFLLDQEEITDFSMSSPYIKCEKYKAKIVDLYKQLCKLTGDEPIKRREVRLQVLPGRPSAPVKCLEEFLNDNIGDNGEPPFPDFHDVLACVSAANRRENLGWNSSQIMNEANMLFTHCGRALQKRRQERAWRDILDRVNLQDIQDPADEDPELLARLEENKRLALKREEDLIEIYTNKAHETKSKKSEQKLIVTNREDISDESEHGNRREVVDAEARNLKPNDANAETAHADSIAENESTEYSMSKMKSEPLDISAILDELGDDFSSAVIEVVDPFMVIEISSDSEDES